jgi:hypothetical protein
MRNYWDYAFGGITLIPEIQAHNWGIHSPINDLDQFYKRLYLSISSKQQQPIAGDKCVQTNTYQSHHNYPGSNDTFIPT